MYTYNNLLVDADYLVRAGAELTYIGSTVAGRMIPCFHAGSYSGQQVIVQGGIHAREHITCQLVVEQAYYFLRRYTPRDKGGVYFIPMVNIDGVSLCQFGLSSVKSAASRQFLLSVNEQNGTDFSMWKANLNAVDLNTNFPARWGTGAENVRYPAPDGYIGPEPASEPETRALMTFTERARPDITVSYHCKGQEIYWDFHQTEPARSRDYAIGRGLAALTGYALTETGQSAGGYKDWCIEKLSIPAYTIEIVPPEAEYPIDYSYLGEEFQKNKEVPLYCINI